MRPVLRDLCISAMQTLPSEEWSTSDVAKSISKTPNGIRGPMEELHNELLMSKREITRMSCIEIRWRLTDAGRAVVIVPRAAVPAELRVPSRWPCRDHDALDEAWPHPVTVPHGAAPRIFKIEGGWE